VGWEIWVWVVPVLVGRIGNPCRVRSRFSLTAYLLPSEESSGALTYVVMHEVDIELQVRTAYKMSIVALSSPRERSKTDEEGSSL